MSRVVSLQLGKIVQFSGLQASNPLQNVTWYAYGSETVDDAGLATQTYTQTVLQARVQPTSHNLIAKYNLEFGHVYKTFYVLTDTVQTTNRNISTAGDFILYNGLYYRVMQIPDEFDTTWQQVIGMQSNQLLD